MNNELLSTNLTTLLANMHIDSGYLVVAKKEGSDSLSTVVLRIGMGPMPAIVELWGSFSSSRSTPITQKYQKLKFLGCVGIRM